MLSRTGRQFYCTDNDIWSPSSKEGRPLLEVMSEKGLCVKQQRTCLQQLIVMSDTIFFKALLAFPNIAVYGNAVVSSASHISKPVSDGPSNVARSHRPILLGNDRAARPFHGAQIQVQSTSYVSPLPFHPDSISFSCCSTMDPEYKHIIKSFVEVPQGEEVPINELEMERRAVRDAIPWYSPTRYRSSRPMVPPNLQFPFPLNIASPVIYHPVHLS
jgi:hypothetical protein